MALGVLNNLSAVYASNNLNNTNNSLQKVLQQLSSGSKINSGADDAAGLSLVNGLAANSTALTQSSTNTTEGVGLLEVADGALSQVTSLLNRAVTLATESSNGTLSTAQQAAANEEYQSLLSEINNIGSTTTYNQTQVFSNSGVSIYTGDSSVNGSSIDELRFATLSTSSVGETSGVMHYTNGKTNVFVNLTNGGTAQAKTSDALGATTATQSIDVTYWDSTAGATATKTITSTDGTVGGLITAINNSNLGISAGFTSASQAGTGATGVSGAAATDTGIVIIGATVGTTAPTATTPDVLQISTGVTDTTSGGTTSATADTDGLGPATTTYTSSAGTDLSTTNLTNTSNAQTALSLLNSAIANVAAQDGYYGAQINTLNAVNSVMTTQQENVLSAQNAVQATDYAQASSAMSKYQILNQTGIAALSQANSTQQAVTKLLQS